MDSHKRNSLMDDEDLRGTVDFDFFADDSKSPRITPRSTEANVHEKDNDKFKAMSESDRSESSRSANTSSHASSPPQSPRKSRSSSSSSKSSRRRSSNSSASPDDRSDSRNRVACNNVESKNDEDDTTAPLTTRRSSSAESRSRSPRPRSSQKQDKSETRFEKSDLSKPDESSDESSLSDVTDVSPLSSRENSPVGRPPKSYNKGDPDSKKRKSPQLDRDEDKMNVEMLMRVLVEMDRERSRSRTGQHLRSNSLGRTGSLSYASFERVKGIEQENQRILQRLMETKRRKRTSTIDPPAARPHHSTINRQREQRRIEAENKKILQRLNKIKPTKNICRDELIKDYKKQASYGLPLFLAQGGQERPPTVTRNPHCQSLRRIHSSSSLVRPSSAAVAQNSGRHPKVVSSRPDWPSGW